MASSTATIYMLSTMGMGLFTFFAITIVLLLAVWIIAYPIKFFWCEVVKGLIGIRLKR